MSSTTRRSFLKTGLAAGALASAGIRPVFAAKRTATDTVVLGRSKLEVTRLAFGTGTGSELRFPLGVTIIGGLLLSQLLTLYTTPVIYLAMERVKDRFTSRHVSAKPSRVRSLVDPEAVRRAAE